MAKKGEVMSEETKKKISNAQKRGKTIVCVCGKEFYLHRYRFAIGKYCSYKCSGKYGIRGCNKGKKIPKGSFAKMGEKNPMWGKQDPNISRAGLHHWTRKRLVKAKACQHCGATDRALDMANKSHEYKRDLTDWLWLCRKCHWKYDDNRKGLEIGWQMMRDKKRVI